MIVKTIWKVDLDITDTQIVRLPKGSVILSAQVQHFKYFNTVVLWYLCDPNESFIDVEVNIVGTGHSIEPDRRNKCRIYAGTIQLEEGLFVGHVFVDNSKLSGV